MQIDYGNCKRKNFCGTAGLVNLASILYSEIGTASGATFVTNSFDAFALGWRFNSTSAANSIDVNSINVNAFTQVVAPEPGTVALFGGGALLALFFRRRQLRR